MDPAALIQAKLSVGSGDLASDRVRHGVRVASGLAVEQHEIRLEPTGGEKLIDQQHFLHQGSLLQIIHLQQDDGVIARNAQAPKARLGEVIGCQGLSAALRAIRIE